MNVTDRNFCDKCGGSRFVPYSELNLEEKIITDSRVERKVEDDFDKSQQVCTRCFSLRKESEIRA